MGFTDFFKVSNFSILLPMRTVEFFVQEVNLPGMFLGATQFNWMAQNEERPGDNITWNKLSLTLICDEDLGAFKEIYNHIMKEKHPETGVMDPITTRFESRLFLTTNKSNVSHSLKFQGCWISNVGDLMLMSTSAEDEQLTFTLEITYSYYEFI